MFNSPNRINDNAFHLEVSLPVEFVEPSIALTPDVLRFRNNKVTSSMINDEFNDWLRSVGLMIDDEWSRYFHSFPHQRYGIHADSKISYLPRTKLNIIFDSYGSEMVWYKYEPKNKKRNIILMEHSAPIPNGEKLNPAIIRNYSNDDCQEIFRTKVDTHCLIDGARIHTLINSDNRGVSRRCYSLTLLNVVDKTPITFDMAKQLLSSVC